MKNGKKKLLGLSLACVMGVSLLACTNNEKPATGEGTNIPTASEAVNRLALERKLEYVRNNYIDNEGKYEKEGFDALKAYYSEAEALLKNEAATQAELDEAVAKLDTLAKALVSIVKPAKSVDEISEWMDSTKGNYTLRVKDHFSKEEYKAKPLEYKVLSDGKAIYDEALNEGLAIYDGAIHEFSISDGNIRMDRKHMADGLFPSRFLKPNEFYSRACNIIGISEPFTSLGLPTYGFFENVASSTIYKSDNSNYYDFFLNLTIGRYNYGNKVEAMFSAATIEMENDIFKAALLDNDGNVAIEFEVENAGSTKIAGLEEYKKAHPEYTSNEAYKPDLEAERIIEADKKAPGIVIDVYSNRRGLSTQAPNYTLTSKVNKGGLSYWSSSLGYGYLNDNGNKSFTIKDNTLNVGGAAEVEVELLDIVNLLIKDYKSGVDANGDDEYYITSLSDDLKNALYTYFDIKNLPTWGSKNFFDESPVEVKASEIVSVSLSRNSEGNLMISLWREKGLICRGVVRQYESVKVDLIEDLANKAKNDLAKLADEYSKLVNIDNRYEANSFKALTTALNLAKEALAKDTTPAAEFVELNKLVKRAYSELELSSFVPNEKGYKEVTKFIDGKIYVDEYGIGDYTFAGYRMVLTNNGKENTYIVNSNYGFNETTGRGVIRYEGIVHSFYLMEGSVKISDPVLHKAGFSQTFVDRVFKKIGMTSEMTESEFEDFNPAKEMVRIPNSNEWFISNVAYGSFMDGVDLEGVIGLGLKVIDNTLVVSAYEAPALEGFDASAYVLADLVQYRGDIRATAVISDMGKAKSEVLDTFLKATDKVVDGGMLATIMSMLPEEIKVMYPADNTYRIYGEKFVYMSETSEAYILVKGKVMKIKVQLDNTKPGFPYTVAESEVKVNGKPAASLAEVMGEVHFLKALTPASFEVPTVKGKASRDKYTLVEDASAKLAKVFGYEDSAEFSGDIFFTLTDMFDIALGDYNAGPGRYEAYIKVTGRLTDQELEANQMIKNFIIAEEMK